MHEPHTKHRRVVAAFEFVVAVTLTPVMAAGVVGVIFYAAWYLLTNAE